MSVVVVEDAVDGPISITHATIAQCAEVAEVVGSHDRATIVDDMASYSLIGDGGEQERTRLESTGRDGTGQTNEEEEEYNGGVSVCFVSVSVGISSFC